jgi:antirestriction protein ArdC
VERTSSREGLPPSVDQRLFTAHCRYRHKVHATGHQKRLAREGICEAAPFGSPAYSKEELTAEFGVAYLCAEAGISNAVIHNQAAYVAGWLR